MGGVRLSFALSQWVELGQKYPEALDALNGIRDQHERTLLAGKGGFSEFHEYVAINRTLKEDDKSYNPFRRLHQKYPQTAAMFFHAVRNLVMDRKDYEICRAYMKDPVGLYEDIRYRRESNLSLARGSSSTTNVEFTRLTDKSFVNNTTQLMMSWST